MIYAVKGEPWACYLAAENVKYRVSGLPQTICVMDTEELAFRYFQTAAEKGMRTEMKSLTQMYEDGTGTRADYILVREWQWRSTLLRGAGSHTMFDNWPAVARKHVATSELLHGTKPHPTPGKPFPISGPNISSVCIVLTKKLAAMIYRVEPFAAVVPTRQLYIIVFAEATGPLFVSGYEEIRALFVQNDLGAQY